MQLYKVNTNNTTKINFIFKKWYWLVLFSITNFSAEQEIFSLVLFDLVLYYYFQYPTRKFPSSAEFREFWELKYKISNSGIPVSFLGLRREGKWPVPNGGTETEPGRGCSRKLGMANFSDFSGKNPVPWKWHSGTQTSIGHRPEPGLHTEV